jgi:hypothetical protein
MPSLIDLPAPSRIYHFIHFVPQAAQPELPIASLLSLLPYPVLHLTRVRLASLRIQVRAWEAGTGIARG